MAPAHSQPSLQAAKSSRRATTRSLLCKYTFVGRTTPCSRAQKLRNLLVLAACYVTASLWGLLSLD